MTCFQAATFNPTFPANFEQPKVVPAVALPIPSSSAWTIGAILILFQLLDGILTAAGLGIHGISMEGNPILVNLMHQLGVVPTLILTKVGASLVVLLLVYLTTVVSWLLNALRCVATLYLVAAILPWTFIIAQSV